MKKIISISTFHFFLPFWFGCPLYIGSSAHYSHFLNTVVDDLQKAKETKIELPLYKKIRKIL